MMRLPPAEFIPDVQLARKASGLLEQYERERGRKIQLPVPITSIIERILGICIVTLPIQEHTGEIILARIDPDFHGIPTIQLNELRESHFQTYFGTEQYSLAHEVGHWVLHMDRGRSKQLELPGFDDVAQAPPFLCRELGDSDRREFQAERFAAYLLLPEYLLRKAAEGHNLRSPWVLRGVARECGVSVRALERRLAELRIQGFGQESAQSTGTPGIAGRTLV